MSQEEEKERGDFEDGMGVVVDDRILLELKAVENLQRIHAAQVLTYMKLARLPIGLLVNFNVPSLRNGLRRFSLRPPSSS